jgi:YspA, cpYpsA-related SLOG family
MRVLVCGGRDYRDADCVNATLDRLHAIYGIEVVIHGATRGADAYAGGWAGRHAVGQHIFRADWESYGKSAGPRRNAEMLRKGKPDLVVVFPGNSGTRDMREKSLRVGAAVIEIKPRGVKIHGDAVRYARAFEVTP